MPVDERRTIEQKDEIAGFLSQSNISRKNLVRLKILKESHNPDVARGAGLVFEIGIVHPHKRKCLKNLSRKRKDLIAELNEIGLIYECIPY